MDRLSIPIDSYLNNLRTSRVEKEKRKKTIKDFYEMMLDIFAIIDVEIEFGSVDMEYIKKEIEKKYRDIVISTTDIDTFIMDHIWFFSDTFIDTTSRHIPEKDTWYLSEDRALFIAENEALDLHNYYDYKSAVKRGFKRKVWIAEIDNKTRIDHMIADGTTIPIDEYFTIGEAQLFFPRDTFTNKSTGYAHPEQIINCRCVAKYIR